MTFTRRAFMPAAAVLFLTLSAVTAGAWDSSEAYPFDKGRTRLSLQAGTTRAFHQSYTVIGIGTGYYILDGLELGLDGDAWMANSAPDIYRVSPGLRYTLYQFPQVRPYAGIFYRRTFIDTAPDRNEAGGRAGITVMSGPRASFSVGLVYDRRFNCDRTVYSSCSDLYSEISLALLF